jgi:hypothetical protein
MGAMMAGAPCTGPGFCMAGKVSCFCSTTSPRWTCL